MLASQHIYTSVDMHVGNTPCCQDWKHQWIWTTISEVQMLCLLVILMWLWRPVDENKTYVYVFIFCYVYAVVLFDEF